MCRQQSVLRRVTSSLLLQVLQPWLISWSWEWEWELGVGVGVGKLILHSTFPGLGGERPSKDMPL